MLKGSSHAEAMAAWVSPILPLPTLGCGTEGRCRFALAWLSAQGHDRHGAQGLSCPLLSWETSARPSWVGRDATHKAMQQQQQLGSAGGCAELPGAPPGPAERMRLNSISRAPVLLTSVFLLHMHKAQCSVRGFYWKETEETSELFWPVNVYDPNWKNQCNFSQKFNITFGIWEWEVTGKHKKGGSCSKETANKDASLSLATLHISTDGFPDSYSKALEIWVLFPEDIAIKWFKTDIHKTKAVCLLHEINSSSSVPSLG